MSNPNTETNIAYRVAELLGRKNASYGAIEGIILIAQSTESPYAAAEKIARKVFYRKDTMSIPTAKIADEVERIKRVSAKQNNERACIKCRKIKPLAEFKKEYREAGKRWHYYATCQLCAHH